MNDVPSIALALSMLSCASEYLSLSLVFCFFAFSIILNSSCIRPSRFLFRSLCPDFASFTFFVRAISSERVGFVSGIFLHFFLFSEEFLNELVLNPCQFAPWQDFQKLPAEV